MRAILLLVAIVALSFSPVAYSQQIRNAANVTAQKAIGQKHVRRAMGYSHCKLTGRCAY